MRLCDYGCGKEARYKFKNGKWCCSKHQNKCESFRKSILGTKNPFYGKKHSEETKNKWKDGGRKFKILGENNGMYGMIKEKNPFYKKKHRVEQKEKWKIDRNNIQYKKMMSELMKDLWKEEWFFESHIKYNKKEIEDLKKYYKSVGNYTRKSLRNYYKLINPNDKKIGYYNYHIDHIFSIIDGFRNRISPEIIGSCINLQVLEMEDNLKKSSKSDITLTTLLQRYKDYENNI